MTTLVDALQARAPELAAQALAPLLRDPFWADRYGDRALRFGREDGAYHVTYLREALRADDVGLLIRYARWLAGLLVARGMSSLHLAAHLRETARVISEHRLPDAERAVAFLTTAARSLAPEAGDAATLSAAAGAIEAALRRTLGDELPRLLVRDGETGDPASLVAYLVDAVAARRPELFARACAHLGPYLVRRGLAPGGLRRALEALDVALGAVGLPPDAAAAGRAVVVAGCDAIAANRGPSVPR